MITYGILLPVSIICWLYAMAAIATIIDEVRK